MAIFNTSRLVLLAVVLLASDCRADWSWGKNSKTAESAPEVVEAVENTLPVSLVVDAEGAGRSLGVPGEVLPLEGHDLPLTGYENYSESEISEDDVGEEGRNGRFLGISEKLCKIGVKGMCSKPKGYPPVVPSHYGNTVASSTYNNYAPYPAQNNFKAGYPKPNFAPPKPLKKLFNDLFNKKKGNGHKIQQSYGVPVYSSPSQGYPPKPTYGAPKPSYVAPKPTYGAPKPTYVAPKPAYLAPKPVYQPPQNVYKAPTSNNYAPPKPTYHAPVPSYSAPKPNYHSPAKTPAYKQTSFPVYDTPKPKDIVVHQIHGHHSVPTHVVAALQPTKVQHIHSHTHIHQDKGPGFDIRDNFNSFPRDDGSYQASSDVRTTIASGSVFPVANTDFSEQKSGVFGDSFKPSQSIPFGDTFQSSQGAFQTNQGAFQTNQGAFQTNQGAFPASQGAFQTNKGAFPASQGAFQTNQGSFPANQGSFQNNQGVFQTSQGAFQSNQDKRHISVKAGIKSTGFDAFNKQQNFQSSIDKLANSFANNGLNNVYSLDCQCVPQQYCAFEDLVARNGVRDLPLDARNQPTDVLSNATSSDYYDYDYLRTVDDDNVTVSENNETTSDTTEYDYDDVSTTTELPTTTTTTTTTETTEESKRVRRSALEEGANSTNLDLQGRQLTGFAPGIHGCGQDYVCCRRPVYVQAKEASAPTCGRGNPSIHGRVSTFEFQKGQSDFGEYPWQAAILRDEGPESMFVCGATLIDDRNVLTAAHCVNDLKVEALKVRLGEWDVNRDTEFYKHEEVSVSGIYVHPEYYKGNLYNDIAVVRLAQYAGIESSPHISPICLPAPNTDFTNYRCQVTGWGKDAFGDKGEFQHILKELELPVVDRRACENALQGTRLGRDYKLHEGFICAGGEEGKDACKGDGGGPLVCSRSDKTFELAGVVSWGIGCGQRGVPGVYVNIPHYVDWIRSTTRF